MREIKFRVWDIKFKRMEEIDGFSLYLADNKIYEVFEGTQGYDTCMFVTDVTKLYELMQYTGLKDKNGKEIYEGDIAILPDRWPKFPVRYIDGMFCLEGTSWPLHEYYKECEIIGNIYENPELL